MNCWVESILSAYNKSRFEKLVEEYDKIKEAVRANSRRRELVDLNPFMVGFFSSN